LRVEQVGFGSQENLTLQGLFREGVKFQRQFRLAPKILPPSDAGADLSKSKSIEDLKRTGSGELSLG